MKSMHELLFLGLSRKDTDISVFLSDEMFRDLKAIRENRNIPLAVFIRTALIEKLGSIDPYEFFHEAFSYEGFPVKIRYSIMINSELKSYIDSELSSAGLIFQEYTRLCIAEKISKIKKIKPLNQNKN